MWKNENGFPLVSYECALKYSFLGILSSGTPSTEPSLFP